MNSPFASVRAVAAVLARQQYADRADAELLRRFAASREEAAFAELVRRYGPLVWRAARTASGNDALAEDAFQATFLALARHAGSLRRPAALVGWLHRTARRAASRARRFESKRSFPRAPAEPAACTDPLDRLTARELLTAVEEEIAALPEAFRVVLLLCGVEGLSQEEAAARLGWSPGSVKGRLERARARLRKRLALRGLTAPTLLGGLVGEMPSALAETTLAAVRGGELSPAVAQLVAGVQGMSAPLWWKLVGIAALAAGGLAFGFGSGADAPQPTASANSHPKKLPPARLALWSIPHGGVNDLAGAWQGIFAPDSKRVLTAGWAKPIPASDVTTGEIRELDAATGKVIQTYSGIAERYSDIAISPDGTSIAATAEIDLQRKVDRLVRQIEIWKRGTSRPWYRTQVEARCPKFSPDGAVLVGIGRGVVLAWNVKGGFPKWKVRQSLAYDIAFHPGGRVIALADATGNGVVFLDAHTRKPRGAAGLAERWPCATVAFSPNGKQVAASIGPVGPDVKTAVSPKRVRVCVWDFAIPSAGNVKVSNPRSASWDGGLVGSLAFSPDGKHLATACLDGTIRLLDPATCDTAATVKNDAKYVISVAFSPDGKRLLTTGQDAVKMWSVAELLKRKPK